MPRAGQNGPSVRERLLIDVAGFQLVWLCCALGAANGTAAPGVAAAVTFVIVKLVRSGGVAAQAQMMFAAGLGGVLVESVFAATGLVRHAAPWPSLLLAPLWIVSLWIAFGATLGTLRAMLGRRGRLLAPLLGAILGPASYWAGTGLGASTLSQPAATSLVVIALLWAAALPLLLLVERRLGKPASGDAG